MRDVSSQVAGFTHETRVTEAFKNGIEYLDVKDEGTFFEVIEAFGTHYTSSIMIGGQYTKYDYFTEEYYETASSNGFNFEEMAEVSFKIVSGSESVSVEKQEECKTEYDEKAEGGSSYYVGGAAFEGSSSDWYQGLVDDESVAPIGKNIEITPIYKLITSAYFPDDESIVEKAIMMKEKLQTYCRWLGESGETCIEEPEDKIPPAGQVKMTDLEGGPNNRYGAEVAIGTYVYRFGGYDDYYNLLKTTAKYMTRLWGSGMMRLYKSCLKL